MSTSNLVRFSLAGAWSRQDFRRKEDAVTGLRLSRTTAGE